MHPLCGNITDQGDKYVCDNCKQSRIQHEAENVTSAISADDETILPTKLISKLSAPIMSTEIAIGRSADTSSVVSTITDTTDYTHIEKDYFVTCAQHVNKAMKERDGDIWKELRKGVQNSIDEDLKLMMILRSQEVGLKIKIENDEETVTCWTDIGKAWRNDDSIDTAKKLYEVVHATFDDKSCYEIYMEANIMKKIKLKYKDAEYKKKGCIARMIITRKSELNKLINKRSDSTHQKKISSKRVELNGDRNSKGTFTVKGPNKNTECYKRDGSISNSKKSVEIQEFDSLFYMEKIRKLENERNLVWIRIVILTLVIL